MVLLRFRYWLSSSLVLPAWGGPISNVPRLSCAEGRDQPAQKTAEEPCAWRRRSSTAPLIASTRIQLCLEPTKPGVEQRRTKPASIVEAAGKTKTLPPQTRGSLLTEGERSINWIEDRGAARCRSAQSFYSPVSARWREDGNKEARHDAFESIGNIPTRRALPARSGPFGSTRLSQTWCMPTTHTGNRPDQPRAFGGVRGAGKTRRAA